MEHDHEHHDHEHVEPISIAGSFVPRPAAGLVTTELDGELLLLDPRTDGLHQLDRLGTVIWKVLDGEATVDDLVDDVAGVFGAPHDAVREDLSQLLVALRHGFLLEADKPPEELLGGGAADGGGNAPGIWRPDYLVDPPAP